MKSVKGCKPKQYCDMRITKIDFHVYLTTTVLLIVLFWNFYMQRRIMSITETSALQGSTFFYSQKKNSMKFFCVFFWSTQFVFVDSIRSNIRISAVGVSCWIVDWALFLFFHSSMASVPSPGVVLAMQLPNRSQRLPYHSSHTG